MESSAILWTGGKDSSLALHEAVRSDCNVRCLATFAPPQPKFLAHPLAMIKLQAEALRLPHHVISVDPPFDVGYESGLRRLRDEMGIECVVTGDIAEVDGHPNWIRERSTAVGMKTFMPLWGSDRNELLQRMLDAGWRAWISCVDTRRLAASWVGRDLDDRAIRELRTISRENGLDLCGEQGEYHTLVVDGPLFTRAIRVRSYDTCMAEPLAYAEIHEMALVDNAA